MVFNALEQKHGGKHPRHVTTGYIDKDRSDRKAPTPKRQNGPVNAMPDCRTDPSADKDDKIAHPRCISTTD